MDIAPLFCPFCRKELLEENTQFCGNCGRNLSLSTDPEEHTPTHKTIRPMPVLPESQTPATVVPHTPPPNNPSEYPPKRQPSPKRRNILKLGVIGVTSVAALSALGTGAFVVTHQQASQGHPTVTPTSQAATTLTPNGWEERSLARPALTVFNGQPYLAWTSIDNHIKIARCSNNSTSMSVTTLPSATSYQGSALAVFNNRLYVAWTGTDNSLNIASSSDGTTFTNSTKFSSSSQAPALTAFNNQLYLVWTGTDNILYVAGSSDGSSFVPIGLSGTSSQKAPGAIAFNNQLYVAWAGTDNLLHIVRLTPPFYVGV